MPFLVSAVPGTTIWHRICGTEALSNNPLDIRQLQNFVALAHERSYTKAAKRVFLSQSAISHSIRSLEAELGCKLIKKAGHKLILTEHGEVFFRESEEILDRIHGLRRKMSELGRWGRGRIRIGAGATACQHFLPPVLREIQDTFPECDLVVHPGDTPLSLQALRAGQVDVSIMVRSKDISDCTFYRLFSDELRLVFNPSHAWARSKRLTTQQFSEETILLYSRGSATYEITQAYFESNDIRVRRSVELGSMEALKEMARIGHGIALLPDWVIEDDDPRSGLVSRPLPGHPIRREWGVAYLKGKQLSLLEETFVGLCEEQARAFTGKNQIYFPAETA